MEQSPSRETDRFSVQEFPEFDGNRRFVTSFTRAHHLSLFEAISIQPIVLPEDQF